MNQKLNVFQVKKVVSECLITVGGMLFIVGMTLLLFTDQTLFTAALLLFVGTLLFISGGALFTKLLYTFTDQFFVDVFSDIIDRPTYRSKQGLSSSQVYNAEFFNHTDYFQSQEHFRGIIADLAFVSSHVSMKSKKALPSKSGTRKSYETVFLGHVFIVDFNRPFTGFLQCLQAGQQPQVKRNYRTVSVLQKPFDQQVKIFATNTKVTQAILTPHVIDLIELLDKINPGTVNLSFIDSKMYIAIYHRKKPFYLSLYKPFNKKRLVELKRIFKVVSEITEDIKNTPDSFKLDA